MRFCLRSFQSMLSLLFPSRRRVSRTKTRRACLAVEQLEDRIALSSTYIPIGPAPISGIKDGGFVSGRATAFAIDPNDASGNTVYIGGAGGGVWEGQNIHSASPTWTDLTANLATLTSDPFINLNVGALLAVKDSIANQTVLYIGLGETNSFTNLLTPGTADSQFYGAGIVKMVVTNTFTASPPPPTIVSAALLGTGAGQSNQFYGTAVSRIVGTSGGIVYAAVSTAKNGVTGGEGIWKSTNGGLTWQNMTATAIPGSDQDEFTDLIMFPGNPNVLYAAIGQSYGSARNGVWMTTNGGVSWSEMQGTSGSVFPSGVGVGRITLALSGNLGSVGSPLYELYAAYMTSAATQTANILSASKDKDGTVKVNFSGFSGLLKFQAGETNVELSGVFSNPGPGGGDNYAFNGLQTIGSVSYSSATAGSLTYSSGISTADPETLYPSSSATVSSEPGTLYFLGFVLIQGKSSDTTRGFGVVPGFNFPVANGIKSKYNYVGDQGDYGTSLIVDPYSAQGAVQVYAGGMDTFLSIANADSASPTVNDLISDPLTNPDGTTIPNAYNHVDHHGIAIDPDPAAGANAFTVLDGNDGGAYAFDPQNSKWIDLNANLQLAQMYGILGNPRASTQVLGGAQDNGNFFNSNTSAGNTWASYTAGDGNLLFYDPHTNNGFITKSGSLYTTNGANPFTGLPNPFTKKITPSLNPPGKNIGDFPAPAYFVQPVNVNGTYKDYLWYGGEDGNSKGGNYPNNAVLFLSTDGGTNWPEIGNPTIANSNWPAIQRTSVNGFNVDNTAVESISASVTYNSVTGTFQSIVYAGLHGGDLLVSTNSITSSGTPNPQATWTVTNPVPITTTLVTAVGANSVTVQSTANFPASGNLFVETDPATGTWTYVTYTGISGNTFTGIPSTNGLTAGDAAGFQNDLKFTAIAVDPYNPQIAFVSVGNFASITGGGQVYMTANGGQSWTNISGGGAAGLPNVPTRSLQIQQPSQGNLPVLYVGNDLGVYWTTNLGATWSSFGSGLPNVQVRDLSLDLTAPTPELLVATLGHSAYEISPNLSPTPTVTSYIESAYLNLLHRPADPGGLTYWTNLLNSLGNSAAARAQVVADIEQSQEYLDDVVTALYQHYLNRAPDSGGLAAWVGALQSGATIEQVTAGFVSSPEFFHDAGGTNGDYVNGLYQDILGRHADPGGFNTWVTALINGASTVTVAMGFLTSAEYRQDLVAGVGWAPTSPTANPPSSYFQGYYLTYLGRQGDPGGVASWVAELQGGTTDQQVIAGILGSPEFYNNSV